MNDPEPQPSDGPYPVPVGRPVPIEDQIGPPPGGWGLPDGDHEIDRPDVVGQTAVLGGVSKVITSATHRIVVKDGKIVWQAVKARFDGKRTPMDRPSAESIARISAEPRPVPFVIPPPGGAIPIMPPQDPKASSPPVGHA